MRTFFLSLLLCNLAGYAQVDSTATDTVRRFNYKPLIVPAILVGYGILGFENHNINSFNAQIREEVREDIDEKITIDDFSQYAPMAAVYGLNAAGIKGRNDFGNRSLIMATSYLIMSATVLGLKSATKVERPDGSSNNSFPSGHTATAFAGAEFLWQEYKDQSILYGISGYVVATGTGMFRMYNNRHWLTDVATGAGIGILSTKIAYWVNPYLQNKIFGNKDKKVSSVIMPFYNGKQIGLGLGMNF